MKLPSFIPHAINMPITSSKHIIASVVHSKPFLYNVKAPHRSHKKRYRQHGSRNLHKLHQNRVKNGFQLRIVGKFCKISANFEPVRSKWGFYNVAGPTQHHSTLLIITTLRRQLLNWILISSWSTQSLCRHRLTNPDIINSIENPYGCWVLVCLVTHKNSEFLSSRTSTLSSMPLAFCEP